MGILDEEASLCVGASWALRTRTAYDRGFRQWGGFVAEVGLTQGGLVKATAREREQWAVRFQVWLMWRGCTPEDASQLVYNASAALRGRGLGSLLELSGLGRHSRIAAVKRGMKNRRAESGGTGGTRISAELTEKCVRPLTDWELRMIRQWWLEDSGEVPAVARRWGAVITVAYYACWRPSQFTKPSKPAIPWQQWLVRVRDVVSGAAGLGWEVRTQKARDSPFMQFYFRDGPAREVLEAVRLLLTDSEEAGGVGRKWLCWLTAPNRPIEYAELLQRWGDGVRGARLERGVGSPYALRRGGATFWYRQGLTWQEVGAANGWKSAQVRKYIMAKQWRQEQHPRAATGSGAKAAVQ